MAKKILSVGFEFPGNAAEYVSLKSDRSLLDADIIVFQPKIQYQYRSSGVYQGKPNLSESDSFRVVEDSAHWRSELKAAFDEGKTIIIFLSRLEEYYIFTGQKTHSGTGRSRVTTNMVTLFNNYKFLPFSLDKITTASGKEIRVAKDLKFIAPYWKEFAKHSPYEVYLEGDFTNVILTTKSGNRIIGAIITGQKGTVILLPPISYDEDEFVEYDEKEEEEIWTKKAIAFGKSLLSHIIEIDNSLQSNQDMTPAPEWTKQEVYRLESETVIEGEIKAITRQIEELQNARSKLNLELAAESKLRWLLYEKGHFLEEAILSALKLMSFEAEPFRDAESEFDAVFISAEGRFLGEAEGKDNSAVNINKLSQLERNLQEDYSRDEVDEYAHGVLFGNSYRLQHPSERPDFFTEKCVSGAKRGGTALVRTPDLYNVAKYLKEHDDTIFAKQCREAIFNSKGSVVQFPNIPADAETTDNVETVENNQENNQ
jgi:hypothetical protein